MPKKLDTWACSVCQSQFGSRKAAIECEKVHEENQSLVTSSTLREKQLPTRHKEDDLYIKHCVLCGGTVKEREYHLDDEYEGRHSPGRVLFEDKTAVRLAGGWYCGKCKDEFHTMVKKADREVLEYIVGRMR